MRVTDEQLEAQIGIEAAITLEQYRTMLRDARRERDEAVRLLALLVADHNDPKRATTYITSALMPRIDAFLSRLAGGGQS